MRFVRSLFCVVLACALFCAPCSVFAVEKEYREAGEISYETEHIVTEEPTVETPDNRASSWVLTPEDDSDITEGKTCISMYYGYTADDTFETFTRLSYRTLYINNMAGSNTLERFDDRAFPYGKLTWNIYNDDNSVLFKKNAVIDVAIPEGSIRNYIMVNGSSTQGFWHENVAFIGLQVIDINGTYHNIEEFEYTYTNTGLTYSFTNIDSDITTVIFLVEFEFDDVSPFTPGPIQWFVGFESSASVGISVNDPPSEEVGLLQGIIEWLMSIRDGIVNVFNAIAELPSKIGNFILDGLKSLFIPDETYMTGYKDKWDNLLKTRFGAVYEAGTLVTDYFSAFQDTGATNIVDFPIVSVNVSEGEEFTFGGYTVELVPPQFQTIVNILKSLLSIVCTFAFVNALKNRFSKLLGGDEV